MGSAKTQEYLRYVSMFKSRFGVDYTSLEDTYLDYVDSVGVYPDVSLLLYSLSVQEDIKKIVEIGAGMSTCVFSKAIHGLDKKFISIESSRLWSQKVQGVLQALSLKKDVLVCTEDTEAMPQLPNGLDFLWVDGHVLASHDRLIGRVEACRYYQEFLDNTVVAFDDAQWMGARIQSWLNEVDVQGSRISVVFNPTGRQDRHVFLTIPAGRKDLVEVVNACM